MINRIEIERTPINRTEIKRTRTEIQVIKEMEEARKRGDYVRNFELSVELAELCGVPNNKILRNKADIDNFFMG